MLTPSHASPELPRVVVLAAGQGSRLGGLAEGRPKSLLPISGEPLLVRTIRQLEQRGFGDVVVVTGYRRDLLEAALKGTRARFVENPSYATDTNIGSLCRGLEQRDSRSLIIEADVAFDDGAMEQLREACLQDRSIWFTHGPFRQHQLGGILRADADGRIVDLKLVPRWEPAYLGWKKLLGVLAIGSSEAPGFLRLLTRAAAESTSQYYMMPWVEHLRDLPCWECDLGAHRAATFNTPEDYQRCCELFETETPS